MLQIRWSKYAKNELNVYILKIFVDPNTSQKLRSKSKHERCCSATLIEISISHISIVLIENVRQTFFISFAREVFRHCMCVKRELCFYLIVSDVYSHRFATDNKCIIIFFCWVNANPLILVTKRKIGDKKENHKSRRIYEFSKTQISLEKLLRISTHVLLCGRFNSWLFVKKK